MREGFDHHRAADFTSLDAFGRSAELGLKAAHETQLQQYTGFSRGRQDRIAFLEVEGHGFFQKYVLAIGRCLKRQIFVRKGGGSDDDRIELGFFEGLFQATKTGIDP